MKEKQRVGILWQVASLFLVGILVIGVLTYFSQRALAYKNVRDQTEDYANDMSRELMRAIKEYPSYHWLIPYWYEHADELDIEYDSVFYDEGSQTEKKSRLLARRHPDLQLRYARPTEIEELPAEDQKLYAEIVYSWVVNRFNQMKRNYNIDFLFCVLTDEPYDTQFFLFSGADEDDVRGTNYEEIYPLGVTVTVSESQQKAMRDAIERENHLADAGAYLDYYSYLGKSDGHAVLIGMTYNLSSMQKEADRLTRDNTLYSLFLMVALALICLVLINFRVLKPLKKVQRNIRLYTETKDSAAVAENLSRIYVSNEIGQLSEDVIGLTGEIDDYLGKIETITAEKERIVAELDLARKIQKDMLPSDFPAFPERSEFDIYASMTPAREVGGDFYDFFLIDDDHLGLVMADVSGKGVPAALVMMVSKILLKNHAMGKKAPETVFSATNSALCANNEEEMFVTAWLGVLEISSGKLIAVNAGHEYPVLKQPDGKFTVIKDKHSFVLGAMDGAPFAEYELCLKPGAKLFLYTDGVPEATDSDKKMFGMDRMVDALNREPDADPEKIIENVRSSVDGFVKDAEQFDDLTMMCVSYSGWGSPPV